MASTRDTATSAPVSAAAAISSAVPASPGSSAFGGLWPVLAFHAWLRIWFTTNAAASAAPAPMSLATIDCFCWSSDMGILRECGTGLRRP